MEKYFEINQPGHNVRCKLYFDKNVPLKKIILFGHGFAGHKDNGACEKFATRILTKYKGIGVLIHNLPCHGDDVKKKMTLEDCETYMDIVLEYIKETLGVTEIYSYATSFGGYLVLRYIARKGNPFKKIALRCPAINMYDVMMNSIMKKDEYEILLKGKNVAVGFDRKIDISLSFMEQLKENDIRQIEYLDFAEDVLILHGTKDEVVAYDEDARFADNNVIEFITVENADHRFQNPKHMEIATKAVLEFFEL